MKYHFGIKIIGSLIYLPSHSVKREEPLLKTKGDSSSIEFDGHKAWLFHV